MHEWRLGVVESRFADIVWQHAPLTTARLVSLCAEELDWKRTTTYTVLKRFIDRGIFRNEGGTVTVCISREDFYTRQTHEFVEQSFAGSLPAFLAAFTAGKSLTAEEVADIRRLIDSCGEG
ncbi:MAG: BlaI/MecI/CopY family transcriptional regulator [Clostridia bacterium]|nr:BlaI/MecI/CopY family transcriptional regulator [Clostridia bacterium]